MTKEKKILLAISVSSIALLIVVLYCLRYSVSGVFFEVRTIENKAIPAIEFETGLQYQFFPHKDKIIMLNNEGLNSVSKNGAHDWVLDIKYANPIMYIKGDYIMLADRGGNEAALVKGSSRIYSVSTETPIITSKINSTGYMAVASEEIGYKGMITVYNPSGREIFKWYSGEGYIVDMDLSRDGKNMVVCTVTSDSAEARGVVTFLNMKSREPLNSSVKKGAVVFAVKYNKDGSAVALSDRELMGFGRNGAQRWAVDFKGMSLQTYNIDSNDTMVLGFLNNKNSTTLEIYSKDGRLRGEYVADNEVKNISVVNDTIVISKMRDIYVISPRGKIRVQTESPRDIRDIKLFANKREILSVGGGSADIINIR